MCLDATNLSTSNLSGSLQQKAFLQTCFLALISCTFSSTLIPISFVKFKLLGYASNLDLQMRQKCLNILEKDNGKSLARG